VDATTRLDGRIKQREVALDGSCHRGTIVLPERGAALDVGEEEGHGAAGEIGQDVRSALLVKLHCQWHGYERVWYDAHDVYQQRSTAQSPILLRWRFQECR
jgi:hypothetical protein